MHLIQKFIKPTLNQLIDETKIKNQNLENVINHSNVNITHLKPTNVFKIFEFIMYL